ncbi:unnamed protein product [uncultured bacterium]|nr:unnamed protein product [uncultured bacterium]
MKTLILSAIRCSLMFLVPSITYAISTQWDLDPISGDWNTAANWTPNGVPNGPADTATFGLSHTSDVSISANTEVNSIIFTPAATNPYTISVSFGFTLTLSGTGIINNSGTTQHFVANGGEANSGEFGSIRFTNSATAGSSTTFTNNHGTNGFFGGITLFSDTSTAGSATFINKNGTVGESQGETVFFDNSTAGNGTFINNGSIISNLVNSGSTGFFDSSTAGNATITNNGAAASDTFGGITFLANNSSASNGTFINNAGTVSGAFGGFTDFLGNATAASSTLIANGATIGGAGGGQIFFSADSTGGTSRIEVFGNGFLDISDHSGRRGVTIGSIEGDGDSFLGANNLTVGSNDLSTTFSGVIQDGGVNGGVGGSLTKIGTGTLDLTGASTYTGSTNVNRGVLQVDGSISSNTSVRGRGTLAGTGTINGNVTNNGRVSPGEALGAPGMLTVVHSYTQAQFATLMIQIAGMNTGQFSVLNVMGNADLNGFLDPVLLNGFVPSIGDSFVFLDSASLTGAFSRILRPVFNNGTEQWSVIYQNNNAILTVGPNTIPDLGSTFLLLTLGLLGLMTYRRQLLRGQS